MNKSLIEQQLGATVTTTHFENLGKRYGGKVRDTYALDDRLVLITSDRISAFDHILRQTIPFKGQVLNGVAAYFFEQTKDIVQNHVLEIPDPNVTIARRCASFPVEFVVRGYLAGHAWRTYQSGERMLCGKLLPDSLKQNSKLPTPILTPATKAEEGHDEDISRENIIKRGILTALQFDELESYSLALFQRGTECAARQALILVDTKYEFGLDANGVITLIDEIHTPDSSRYFYADTYEELLHQDAPQRQLSKEFVREWLMAHGFQGLENQVLPDLDDSFRIEVASRYIELFEQITGQTFTPDTNKNPIGRISKSIEKTLNM
jgi:phosphoribosylaminoimidazole-succinocarboxamide synthase